MATSNPVAWAQHCRAEAARFREHAAHWAKDDDSDFAAVCTKWAAEEDEQARVYEELAAATRNGKEQSNV